MSLPAAPVTQERLWFLSLCFAGFPPARIAALTSWSPAAIDRGLAQFDLSVRARDRDPEANLRFLCLLAEHAERTVTDEAPHSETIEQEALDRLWNAVQSELWRQLDTGAIPWPWIDAMTRETILSLLDGIARGVLGESPDAPFKPRPRRSRSS